MEETKLKSFIDKLSLKQLDDLQNRINIRRAELVKTTPEQEEIIRLFRPRSDTTIQDYILRKREN